MKKIILLALLLLVASNAYAWHDYYYTCTCLRCEYLDLQYQVRYVWLWGKVSASDIYGVREYCGETWECMGQPDCPLECSDCWKESW
jgi:uncharacterized protein YxeA